MKRRPLRPRNARHSRQSGYAYFMAFFMITVMIITSQAVLRNMVNEGRRQRENEMVWRGNQYVRAVRLYYKKTGHFPQSIDDLQKGLPDLHFVRPECLKDPMNKADGSWRFIYTNAQGQIIGSVRYATMQQMAIMDLNDGKMPSLGQDDTSGASGSQGQNQDQSNGAPSASSTPAAGSQDQTQQPSLGPTTTAAQGQTQQLGAPTTPSSPFGAPMPTTSTTAGGPFGQANGQLNGLSQASLAAIAQLKPTGPVDGPVFGAFIAGVAGGNHYDASSVKFYKGGKKYSEWEFIWNPLEEQARALQNGLNPQQGALGQPGQPGLPVANPNGGAPVTPENPQGGGPQPSPDQPQQPPPQQPQ